MIGLLTLRNAFWLITTLAEIVLLAGLLRRRMQGSHAAFILYLAANIAQSALAACMYWYWGYGTRIVFAVIWTSQGIVICLRFAAVMEMARRILSGYKGIWSVANRLLWATGLSTILYSMLVAKKQLSYMVLNLDRALELAIAAFIVALLLFVRYYLLPLQPLDRALSIGFCLYSCFYAINDSLFEKYLGAYLIFWQYLGTLTFLASLLIWFHALRAHSRIPGTAFERKPLAEGVYATLSPALNFRLQHLNEQLSQLLHPGKTR
jgi:hypothetical protein